MTTVYESQHASDDQSSFGNNTLQGMFTWRRNYWSEVLNILPNGYLTIAVVKQVKSDIGLCH